MQMDIEIGCKFSKVGSETLSFDKVLFFQRISRTAIATNGRFGAMAAVARRQFCTKLHVIIPQQV